MSAERERLLPDHYSIGVFLHSCKVMRVFDVGIQVRMKAVIVVVRTAGHCLRPLAVAVFLALLSGCGNLPKDLQRSLAQVTPQQVDFVELEYYALRAEASYTSAEEIKRQFPDVTRVTTVDGIDVLYFLETDPRSKTQTITIRGTANNKNIWADAKVRLVSDKRLGFKLHSGFRDNTLKVHEDIKPYLKDEYEIRLTGHSLGGAMALILTNYLYREGYHVERLVTFGQPKVTDDKSDHHYRQAGSDYKKITRVVRMVDPIPLVPPVGVVVRYGHVGPELILKPGQDYVFLEAHEADRLSIGAFWRSFGSVHVKDHSMALYVQDIQEKIRIGARQVPYRGPVKTLAAGVGLQ